MDRDDRIARDITEAGERLAGGNGDPRQALGGTMAPRFAPTRAQTLGPNRTVDEPTLGALLDRNRELVVSMRCELLELAGMLAPVLSPAPPAGNDAENRLEPFNYIDALSLQNSVLLGALHLLQSIKSRLQV